MSQKYEAMSTKLIHHEKTKLPPDNHPIIEPVQISTKYYFDSYQDLEQLVAGNRQGFLYSRVLNPTVRSLEKTLAKFQGTEDAICTSSGVSAISTLLFTLLESGDHVLYFIESYKPTRYIVQKFLGKWGIKSSIASLRDHKAIEDTVSENNVKLIIFESPSNPLLHIADINFMVKIAKENSILTVLDNTFAGFHNHANLGIDFYIHSLTKFGGGHSDSMGGAILSSQKNINKIRWPAAEIGACLSPMMAYEIQKGLKTYPLRYEKSCANALKVAGFLLKRPEVSEVRYPGLDDFSQKPLVNTQMVDFGTIISFKLAPEHDIATFLNSLKLFKISPSLGTVESLAAPVELFYGGLLTEAERLISGITGQDVRLSIGIENYVDLIADLEIAFKKL